jgi:hypothetical protein
MIEWRVEFDERIGDGVDNEEEDFLRRGTLVSASVPEIELEISGNVLEISLWTFRFGRSRTKGHLAGLPQLVRLHT